LNVVRSRDLQILFFGEMNDILEASRKFVDRLLASYSTTSAEEQSLIGWITGIQHSEFEKKVILLSTIKILADKIDGESLKADAGEPAMFPHC
jgi:hypothetical protein